MYGTAYNGLDLGGGVMSIPGSAYDAIATYHDRNIPSEMNQAQIRNIVEMILPAYHNAVVNSGLPVYTYAPESSANKELFEYLIGATSQSRDTIQDVLFSLEQCVLTGTVDGKYLQPNTWKEIKPPSSLQELFAPATDSVSATLGKQFNKILIGAGIVIVLVMLGSTAIKSSIRST